MHHLESKPDVSDRIAILCSGQSLDRTWHGQVDEYAATICVNRAILRLNDPTWWSTTDLFIPKYAKSILKGCVPHPHGILTARFLFKDAAMVCDRVITIDQCWPINTARKFTLPRTLNWALGFYPWHHVDCFGCDMDAGKHFDGTEADDQLADMDEGDGHEWSKVEVDMRNWERWSIEFAALQKIFDDESYSQSIASGGRWHCEIRRMGFDSW